MRMVIKNVWSSANPMKKRTNRRKKSKSIPRATFVRLIKEITDEVIQDHNQDMHEVGLQPMLSSVLWCEEAKEHLHEAAEDYVEEHFRKAGDLSRRFKNKTVRPQHFNDGISLRK